MKVKIDRIGPALHPSEVVIAVPTRDGQEQLAVSKSSLHNDFIDVGWPVGQSGDHYLIELPRETFTGIWRVWVDKDKVHGNGTPERVPA